MPRIKSPEELEKVKQDILSKRDPNKSCISVCAGTGCLGLGAGEVIAAFQSEIEKQGLNAEVDTRVPAVLDYAKEVLSLLFTPKRSAM